VSPQTKQKIPLFLSEEMGFFINLQALTFLQGIEEFRYDCKGGSGPGFMPSNAFYRITSRRIP